VIAIDTNMLVYAHRLDCEFNQRAHDALTLLAVGRAPWAIPWPCVHEFFSIVTHPRIWNPPTPVEQAIAQIEAWRRSSSVTFLAEPAAYWEELRELLRRSKIVGPKVHDARIAAICSVHGVRELWSADRDFSRFAGLSVVNPLTAP